MFDIATIDLIYDTLGPDVTVDCYNDTIMPYYDVYERTTSQENTRRWWKQAHDEQTLYHDRFRGYCPHCV